MHIEMNHDEEINRLHRRQTRTKFVIFIVVAFLALLTYLLINVSQQIASNDSLDFRSRASEYYSSTNQRAQDQGIRTQQDEISCYSIEAFDLAVQMALTMESMLKR